MSRCLLPLITAKDTTLDIDLITKFLIYPLDLPIILTNVMILSRRPKCKLIYSYKLFELYIAKTNHRDLDLAAGMLFIRINPRVLQGLASITNRMLRFPSDSVT